LSFGPGELDACRADDQVRTTSVRLAERDDGGAALAQTHVVGEDGATSTEQEGDAGALMRVQTRLRVANLTCRVRERFRRRERGVCIRSGHVLTPAVRLAVGTLGILDPHLDRLREPRVANPQLGTTRRDDRS
jgi:hypothetical protein